MKLLSKLWDYVTGRGTLQTLGLVQSSCKMICFWNPTRFWFVTFMLYLMISDLICNIFPSL